MAIFLNTKEKDFLHFSASSAVAKCSRYQNIVLTEYRRSSLL